MSPSDDSILTLFISQPLVLWSFLLGVLILLTAVTLTIFSNRRRKKTAVAQQPHRIKLETVEPPPQLPPDLVAEIEESNQSINEEAQPAEEPAVNPLAGIAEEESANALQQPEIEVNSKLADLFQNEIIVDPQVQALRDSLDEVPIADLLTQIRSISGRLKEDTPPMPKFEER